jgi:malate synthase
MEDAATAEISRAQLWQWIRHDCKLLSGEKIDSEFFIKILKEELILIKEEIGKDRFENGKFTLASQLFESMIISEQFDEFLTLPAYKYI